ncbi:MAG: hypothetical protein ACOYCB_09435 [Fastidiosipilaceae bacterium]
MTKYDPYNKRKFPLALSIILLCFGLVLLGGVIYLAFFSSKPITEHLEKIPTKKVEVLSNDSEDQDNASVKPQLPPLDPISIKPSRPENIAYDVDNNTYYVNNEFILQLPVLPTQEEHDQLIEELVNTLDDIGSEVVGQIDEIETIQVQTFEELTYPEIQELEHTYFEELDIKLNVNEVYYFSLHPLDETKILAPDATFLAWNLESLEFQDSDYDSDQLETVRVGLLNTDFQTNYRTLSFADTPLYHLNDTVADATIYEPGICVAGFVAAQPEQANDVQGIAKNAELYGASLSGVAALHNSDKNYFTIYEEIVCLSYLLMEKECQVINIGLPPMLISGDLADSVIDSEDTPSELIHIVDSHSAILSDYLLRVLDSGHDFLIVVGAGQPIHVVTSDGREDNPFFDLNNRYTAITDPVLKKHLISTRAATQSPVDPHTEYIKPDALMVGLDLVGLASIPTSTGEGFEPYALRKGDVQHDLNDSSAQMTGIVTLVLGVNPSIPSDVVKDIICLYGTKHKNLTQAALPSIKNAMIAAALYETGGVEVLQGMAREIPEPNYGIILDEDGPKMSETTPTEVPSTQTPSTTVATSEAVTEPPVEITPTYNNGDVVLTGRIQHRILTHPGNGSEISYFLFVPDQPIDVIGDFGEVYNASDMEIFLIGQVTADDVIPYDGRRVRISGELVGQPTTGARARDVSIKPYSIEGLD